MTALERPVRDGPASRSAADRRVRWAIGGWLTAVVVAAVVARIIGDDGAPLYLRAAPFYGRWDLRLNPAAMLPIAVGAAAVLLLPVAATRLPWRGLLAAASVAAGLWAVALALVDGTSAIGAPLTTQFEYLVDVPAVHALGPADFLRSFTDRIGAYAVHTRGHPPGFVMLAAALDRLGIGGPAVIGSLCIAAGASSVAAAAITVRAVAGEQLARRAIPFLAVAPAAIWIATSADALYLGLATWGIALLALAARSPARGAALLAAAGGVVLAVALHFSYGVAPLGVLALLLLRTGEENRRSRLVAATAGVAAVMLAAWAAGFFWPAGFLATREQWALGVGPTRPQWYFVVANLAVFGTAIGPAAIAGLARLRSQGLRLLVAGGVIAVAVADLSGISRGEVERIWLPFTPWLLVATADLDQRRSRWWLGAQVALTVVLQVTLRSEW